MNESKQTMNEESNIWSYPNSAWKLSTTYIPGYRFPDWTIDSFSDELAQKSKVYYDKETNLSDVKELVLKREPVNIGMSRLYNGDKLEEYFGYSKGVYDKLYNKGIPPNVAIYNYTPVDTTGKSLKNPGNPTVNIHVINCIGYAFDNRNQPDYLYFMKTLGPQERRFELIKRYESIFQKIWKCAEDHKLTTVVLSLVGGGVFSSLYNDDLKIGFQRSVWVPAFFNSLNSYVLKNITIQFMGAKNSDALTLINMNSRVNNIIGYKCLDIGFFPDNISFIDPEKTLFVNAWDPWSMPGNGNWYDASLDGYIGRRTMIALLSWPLTNEHMNKDEKYIEV